jgi:hypothetical protein
MLSGQNGCYFSSKLPASEGLLLLKKASEELKNNLRTKGTKIHLTIFKDFSEDGVQDFNNPEFKSFFRFTTQPNMIFQIKRLGIPLTITSPIKLKNTETNTKGTKKKQKGLRKESYL